MKHYKGAFYNCLINFFLLYVFMSSLFLWVRMFHPGIWNVGACLFPHTSYHSTLGHLVLNIQTQSEWRRSIDRPSLQTPLEPVRAGVNSPSENIDRSFAACLILLLLWNLTDSTLGNSTVRVTRQRQRLRACVYLSYISILNLLKEARKESGQVYPSSVPYKSTSAPYRQITFWIISF